MRSCPVCRSDQTRIFDVLDGKTYHRCEACQATFLDPRAFLKRDAEYAHYCTHENDVDDAGYQNFLARLVEPLIARLPPQQTGLDYGCGPGPALAAMLKEAGHSVHLFDPFFADRPDVLDRSYNFITCTEVVEHFHDPAREFDRLFGLLKPGGVLAVMTMFQPDDAEFATWHYRNDPTHVVFYNKQTFEYLAQQRGLAFESPTKDIVFLRKAAG